MNRKYQVTSQITGMAVEAPTFEEIKVIRQQLIEEWLAYSGVFSITVLQEDEVGWLQSLADENGEPVPPPPVPELQIIEQPAEGT